MQDQPLRIVGAPGSPYSRKLRAVLRYRRIPHRWVISGAPGSAGLPQPRVQLLPQLVERGEGGALEVRTDSTPLIRELEKRHPGRETIPGDPVVAFLDALLEDYGDEWLTKAMFHYRWAFPADVANAAAVLPRWSRTDVADELATAFGEKFAERQIGRLRVVGSNETTAPVIEESYRRLLGLLDAQRGGRSIPSSPAPAASVCLLDVGASCRRAIRRRASPSRTPRPRPPGSRSPSTGGFRG